jgi:hypothetical protein
MPILSSNQPTFWWDRVPDDRAAEWDALVAGRSVYMGSQYLRAMEDHPKVKTRLAVWTSEGTGSGALPDRLTGVAVFQRVSIESRSPDGHLDLGWIMRLVNRVLHPGGKPFTFSAWVAGQSLGSGPHAHVFEAGLSAVDAALRIDAAFRALARKDKLCSDLSASAWILKDQLSGADLKLSNLQRRGWAQLAFDPVMVLPLKQDWHGIEDWMDALRTKARTKVKAILQRSSQVELVPLDAAQAEAMTDVLYGLYCAVYGRAGLVMGGLAPEDFARLKREHGDDFCLVAHSYEGRWVGFHCGFCTAETPTGERSIEAYFVGFEPSFNKKLGLYQRMLVEFVRWGIQRDASRVIMGRTALEIKSGIGALPVPLTLSVRFRNPVLRALMVLGAGLFVPKPFVPRRAWREDAALDWAERGAESGYQEKGLSA